MNAGTGAVRGPLADTLGQEVRGVISAYLSGFRNIVIHEYVALDLDRVVEALGRLEPIERFVEIVRGIESAT